MTSILLIVKAKFLEKLKSCFKVAVGIFSDQSRSMILSINKNEVQSNFQEEKQSFRKMDEILIGKKGE